MKFLLLFLLIGQTVVAQQNFLCSTQTTWQATQGEDWYVLSRVKLAESLTNQISKGESKVAVEQILGAPNRVSTSKGETIWSYGLHQGCLFHVVFDASDHVLTWVTTSYRRFSEDELGSATNVETSTPYPVFDAISWKMIRTISRPHRDRIHVAANCVKSLSPEMFCKDVDSIFGRPDYESKRGLLTYWIYRTRASTFLVFKFLENQEMIGSYFRHYNNNTGRLNCIPVSGVSGDAQGDELLDQDCWLSTVPGYDWTVFRTGISVRMATYIVPGMTSTDVVSKLGKPTETSTVGELTIVKYFTSPASFLKIDLNKQDRVEKITNIMFPIP